MNDVVKLMSLQIRHKQYKRNHIAGGVIAGNNNRIAVVFGDQDVLESDRNEHDVKKNLHFYYLKW